jgi:glycosyltransferase involved in cell wall biosynthesis
LTVSAARDPLRILIVETRAHSPGGHFPVIFARLADAFLELGFEVDVLTSQGWTLQDDPGFPRLRIRTYGKVARAAHRWSLRLRRLPPPALGTQLVHCAATAVRFSVARAVRREIDAGAVIVLTWSEPRAAALFAGAGRWLCYTVARDAATGGSSEPSTQFPLDGILDKLARGAERRRRRQGGLLRVVTSTEASCETWQVHAAWNEPLAIPLATARTRERIAGARDQLGLQAEERVAVHFGSPHPGKDPETVWRAFQTLPDWRLIVAGDGAAEAYEDWSRREDARPGAATMVFDGFVPEATKDLIYSAADLAVVSFRRGRLDDSGSITDAVSWGIPAVCSDDGEVAETVRHYGLGALFESGDAHSLASAVRRSPTIDPDGLQRAREEFSVHGIALRCLAALGVHP